jgi:hypothetical protein
MSCVEAYCQQAQHGVGRASLAQRRLEEPDRGLTDASGFATSNTHGPFTDLLAAMILTTPMAVI